MKDIFIEQLVKAKPNFKDILKKIITFFIILLFLILFFINFLPSFTFFIYFIFAYMVYLLIIYSNLEYEYILTNEDLDIDVIYNKSKRKNLSNINLKNINVFTKKESSKYNELLKKNIILKDFSSGVKGRDVYVILTKSESKDVLIFIEPNEKLLKEIIKKLTIAQKFI